MQISTPILYLTHITILMSYFTWEEHYGWSRVY
jgi:hypothetical protein